MTDGSQSKDYGSDSHSFESDSDEEDVDHRELAEEPLDRLNGSPSPTHSVSRVSASSSDNRGGDSVDVPPEKLLKRAQRRVRRLLNSDLSHLGASCVDVSVLDDFIRCVPLSRIVFGDFHWRVARAHADLSLAYLDLLALPTQAHDHASVAKTLLTQNVHLSEEPREKAAILQSFLVGYFAYGRSCARLDKDGEAEKALLKCEKIHGEFVKLPCVSDDVAREWEIKIVLALARLFAKKKNYSAAEDEFERCLDLIKRANGKEEEDDPSLVPVLMDLARTKQSRGTQEQIEASIDIFLRAHTINVRAHSEPHHLATARSALSIGRAYAALDEEDGRLSAEAYVSKAVESLEELLGSGHEESQNAMGSLAKLLIRMSRTSEAVDVLKRKLRGRFEIDEGDVSDVAASDHQLLGSLYLSNGELDKARAHFKKCLEIQKLTLGHNHRKTRATMNSISAIPQS